MTKPFFYTLLPFFVGIGCSDDGLVELGGGPEGDARLTADVYTWECTDLNDGLWEGVYGFTVALEYAPDGVQDRELPEAGNCTGDLSMFPMDAGNAGSDIPGSDGDPGWSTSTEQGEMESMADGFWYDNALENNHSCFLPEEIVSSGIELTDAASLSGAVTPAAGTLGTVLLGGGEHTGALEFGEDMEVSWDASGWDETWIQVRMEREGQSWGTVTCNATGFESFNVDNRVWSKLNGDLNVEYINLYVGFQNNGIHESESGIKVETVTRAIHVEVVNEI
jgi:hypothetical protein